MSYISWLREQVGSQQVILVSSTACVADDEGRVLWQRRRDFDCWGLPGGILELDESLPECAVREVREETGLDVEPVRLLGLYSSPDYDVTYPNGDRAQMVSPCLQCRVTGGSLSRSNDETTDLVWLDEIPGTFVWYRHMIEDFQAHLPFATYDRGAAGEARGGEPYFKYIRRAIGQAEVIFAGSSATVLNDDNQLLLQRRSDTGRWGLPAGGMELGERLDQTAITEVREETGLVVEALRLAGVYSGPDFHVTYPHGDRVKYIAASFVCRPVGGELQADGNESLEVGWFELDALPDMDYRHRLRIADALAGREEAVF